MIKNLGLNGIRTEGKEMPDDFYERMDRAGILIDAGYQCCDFWQLPGNGHGITRHDKGCVVLGCVAFAVAALLLWLALRTRRPTRE